MSDPPHRLDRWLIAVAAAALLGSMPSQVVRAQSRPFTPDVERFVGVYLKNGGDKLTTWVQGQTAPLPDQTLHSFKPIDGQTMELVAAEPVIRQPVDLHFDDRGRLLDNVFLASRRATVRKR